MKVEVAYARPERQWLLSVEVSENCTVHQAIELSGILGQCPEIDLTVNKVGIFSQVKPLDTPLRDKDRVEIYRPLELDPMEIRRRRASRSDQQG